MHWELTDDVASTTIEQRSTDYTPIVLKIINKDPLKVELWTSNSEEFTIDVAFK